MVAPSPSMRSFHRIPWPTLGRHRSEGGFADIERITSEVVAVQFDEVERVEEYVAIIAPIANVVEGCDTIIVADDCLPGRL